MPIDDVPRWHKRLQQLNANYGNIARWIGLAGLIVGLSTGNYAMAYACLGLMLSPSVVGRP